MEAVTGSPGIHPQHSRRQNAIAALFVATKQKSPTGRKRRLRIIATPPSEAHATPLIGPIPYFFNDCVPFAYPALTEEPHGWIPSGNNRAARERRLPTRSQ